MKILMKSTWNFTYKKHFQYKYDFYQLEFLFLFQAKALGKILFEQVCRQLSLLEADYFGLEYQEIGSNIKVNYLFTILP